MTEPLLVLTTLPDMASARALAEALVTERLAACVNLASASTSIYRWQGAVESAEEIVLSIKTTGAVHAALCAAIAARHPYQVPELITLKPHHVAADYLNWWLEQCSPQPRCSI